MDDGIEGSLLRSQGRIEGMRGCDVRDNGEIEGRRVCVVGEVLSDSGSLRW